jgi:hypothetical protein
VGCMGTGSSEATCRPVSVSWHYCDRAFDIGSKEYCSDLQGAIRSALSGEFGCSKCIEGAGTTNQHYHIQFPVQSPGKSELACSDGTICTGAAPCVKCQWVPLAPGTTPPPGAQTATLGGLFYFLQCQ